MVEISVPQSEAFREAGHWLRLENFAQRTTLLFAIIIPLMSGLTNRFEWLSITMDGLTAAGIVLTYAFEIIFQKEYRRAEEVRRDGLIDAAFNTKMADIKAVGYYDNGGIDYGYLRLLAQIHQNSFETERIVTRMAQKSCRKNILFFCILVFFCCASVLSSHLFLAALQGLLSVSFLSECLKLRRLRDDAAVVQNECRSTSESILKDKRKTVAQEDVANIMRILLRYETSLAYASVMLDGKLFDEINPLATQDWLDIKQRFYGHD